MNSQSLSRNSRRIYHRSAGLLLAFGLVSWLSSAQASELRIASWNLGWHVSQAEVPRWIAQCSKSYQKDQSDGIWKPTESDGTIGWSIMANEELFFGEDGTTNGAHNDITRVTQLLHHAVAEMGMYCKTRLNFGSLAKDRSDGSRALDAETRSLMEAQSERLYSETKAVLAPLQPLTVHLVDRLLQLGEMGLAEVLSEIRSFEARQA